MRIKGRGRLLEPVEFGSRIPGAATVMAGSRGLLEDHGIQYEETF